MKIDILLSTYNGGKYLKDLLDSILNQSFTDWRLLVRDDGSKDNTLEIIKIYARKYPKRIQLIPNYQNLGPSQSFSELMRHSEADYVMFCDQDDVWLRKKVEHTMEAMKRLEKEYPGRPLLIHTDLTVVDDELRVISNSFWKYQKLEPSHNRLKDLLIQNIATGCTMMINKRLKELAYPIPEQSIMHDWWIALVASLYNGVYHINESTILYRQHSDNSIGAKGYSFRNLVARIGNVEENIRGIIRQGKQLNVRWQASLNEDQALMIGDFINLLHKSRFGRVMCVFKHGFRKHGIMRNIGFIIALLWIPRRERRWNID